jgi:hypothetical protein
MFADDFNDKLTTYRTREEDLKRGLAIFGTVISFSLSLSVFVSVVLRPSWCEAVGFDRLCMCVCGGMLI